MAYEENLGPAGKTSRGSGKRPLIKFQDFRAFRLQSAGLRLDPAPAHTC